jgi:5'-nucleotidase
MSNTTIARSSKLVLVVLIGLAFTGTPANANGKVSWQHVNHHKEKKFELQILAINDFRGQISAGQKVAGRPVGSAPVLAAYLREAAAENPGNTFIVQAGDLVGASLSSSALLRDEPSTIWTMKSMWS